MVTLWGLKTDVISSITFVLIRFCYQTLARKTLGFQSFSGLGIAKSSSRGKRGISLVAQMVRRLPTMQETLVRSLGQEDPLEKEMATHSSTLAWKIPWTESLAGTVHGVTKSRTQLSDFTFCPRGLKMPPDGSRNIFMLQPRKRERMKSKGHMSAESFSFYLGHACFYPIAQNWHTRTPIDIKEIWDCEVCLTRYMAVPEFYQLGRRVNGLGIGNWWCLPKTSCYNPNTML